MLPGESAAHVATDTLLNPNFLTAGGRPATPCGGGWSDRTRTSPCRLRAAPPGGRRTWAAAGGPPRPLRRRSSRESPARWREGLWKSATILDCLQVEVRKEHSRWKGSKATRLPRRHEGEGTAGEEIFDSRRSDGARWVAGWKTSACLSVSHFF